MFGIVAQGDLIEDLLPKIGPQLKPWLDRVVPDAMPSATSAVIGITMLILIALVAVRMLSTLWTLIRLHDFTVVRDGNDLRTEYGLFTRVTATIPVQRVQTISIHQRWLHRRFGRAAIRVTTAGASGIPGEGKTTADREWLAPIIPVTAVRALIHEIDPSLELERIEWTKTHPRAALRLTRIHLFVVAVIAVPLALVIGWWTVGVAGLLGLWAVISARGIAASLGTTLLGERVAFRSGWLHQVVSVARFDRIQSASWYQSFLDRRHSMATVSVDTAGMGQSDLGMAYLPEATAMRLQLELAQAAARAPFTW
jgi:putative membrane protein